MSNTSEGLIASLRLAGTGTQTPLWDQLPLLAAPALFIAGERDDKFCALAQRMASLTSDGTFVSIPLAGHAAHIEQPQPVFEALSGWLTKTRYAAD